jgi:sugar phosphate isomerase/epimerase
MPVITRRIFMQHALAGGLGLCTPALARPSASGNHMSLGMSLYGMKTVPLLEALRQCARIGYRNVELCLDPGFPSEPSIFDAASRKAFREEADRLNVFISALMLNLNLAVPSMHEGNLTAIAVAAEMAHDLCPDQPPPIETISRGRPPEWDALKAGMVDRLGDWADTARATKIRFVLKAHMMMAASTPERLLWLLRQVNRPEIRAAYDYSHFELQDISMDESWSALADYTDFVHVKDTGGDARKPLFLLPGQGRTDYHKLLRLFKTSGYRGPVVVEVSTQLFSKPEYDPIKAAEQSYAALKPAFAGV